jgi:ribosomal protein L7Ae-like RNA K-turn-binding protein
MVTSAEKKARKAEEGAEKSAEKSAKKAKKDKTPKKAAENGAEEEPLVVDAAEVHWRSVLYYCVVYVRLVERHSGTVLSLECGGPCVQAAAAPKKTLLIPIAKPLADEKLAKKVLKLAKKATKRKQIKRGVKEVVKAIRKKFKGCAPARAAGGHSFWDRGVSVERLTEGCACRICVIAGDISPVDVITHLPVLCEENDIPYIYVPSKEVRGASASPSLLGTTLCVGLCLPATCLPRCRTVPTPADRPARDWTASVKPRLCSICAPYNCPPAAAQHRRPRSA